MKLSRNLSRTAVFPNFFCLNRTSEYILLLHQFTQFNFCIFEKISTLQKKTLRNTAEIEAEGR